MERDFKYLAVVIRSEKVKDNDLLVTLFTPDDGLLPVYIYGGRKSIRAVKAPLYSEGVFSLYKKGENGRFSLKDVDIISIHDYIHTDIAKTLYMALFSEMILKVRFTEATLYKLYVDALDLIEDHSAELVASVFISKYLVLNGMSGDYNHCPQCGRSYESDEILGFSLSSYSAVCSQCDTLNGTLILPPNARRFISRVQELSFSEAVELKISSEQVGRIANYLMRVLARVLPERLNSLSFFSIPAL